MSVPTELMIAAVVGRLVHAIDDLDWAALRRVLADPVEVEHTHARFPSRRSVSVDRLNDTWAGYFAGFDGTRHMLSSLIVNALADRTLVRASACVHHFIDSAAAGREWTIYGCFEFRMVQCPAGWRIATLIFTTAYQTGNIHLAALARKRAQDKPRGSTG